jgi:hypothetical protein
MSDMTRATQYHFEMPEPLRKIERASLIIGVLGAIGCIIGGFVEPAQHFLRSYLIGYMFWLGVSLGCMGILMVAHVTSAHWGFVIRRILEAASLNIFMLALLFIPVLFGIPKLYSWAEPGAVSHDKLVQHLHPYLNTGMFVFRTILYFVIWCLTAYLLNRWSWNQDEPPERDYRLRFQNLSAIGLVLYVFTMTFASIDWVMSLDPHWRSTIFGFYIETGQGLLAFCFGIVMMALLVNYRPLSEVITREHVHDLGKLMFAALILWAYMGFSQGLIYWSGNLPDEISWYINRTHGAWWLVGMVLIFGHFFVPFFILLGQDIKRRPGVIAVLALWLMLMRWVDLYWLIVPNFADTKGIFNFSWVNIASTLGIGGLWMVLFFFNLRAHPLLPLHDPTLHDLLEHEATAHGD